MSTRYHQAMRAFFDRIRIKVTLSVGFSMVTKAFYDLSLIHFQLTIEYGLHSRCPHKVNSCVSLYYSPLSMVSTPLLITLNMLDTVTNAFQRKIYEYRLTIIPSTIQGVAVFLECHHIFTCYRKCRFTCYRCLSHAP